MAYEIYGMLRDTSEVRNWYLQFISVAQVFHIVFKNSKT